MSRVEMPAAAGQSKRALGGKSAWSEPDAPPRWWAAPSPSPDSGLALSRHIRSHFLLDLPAAARRCPSLPLHRALCLSARARDRPSVPQSGRSIRGWMFTKVIISIVRWFRFLPRGGRDWAIAHMGTRCMYIVLYTRCT